MSHRVIFSPTAARDTERIPPRIVPAIVEFVYGDLAKSPKRVGKPLARELSGIFSARRGSYRVLYDVDDENQMVSILRVDHRADIYRVR
jgi:mRNA interferase RelE/StbE